MASFRFEGFKVYQDAKQLHSLTVKATFHSPKQFIYLGEQMKRAALSIILNIAEGSGKSSDKDFRRYIQNSLGSVNELAAAIDVARSEKLLADSEYQTLQTSLVNVRNQLGGFSKKLSVVS